MSVARMRATSIDTDKISDKATDKVSDKISDTTAQSAELITNKISCQDLTRPADLYDDNDNGEFHFSHFGNEDDDYNDDGEDDESFLCDERTFCRMTAKDVQTITPLSYSLASIFGRKQPKATEQKSKGKATQTQRPAETNTPPSDVVSSPDLNAASMPSVLTLSMSTQREFNVSLDRLLNALRSHATSLFSIRVMTQNQVWQLNNRHMQLLEMIKELMPLQAIPKDKILAFQENFHALTTTYDALKTHYANNVQANILFENWEDAIKTKLSSVIRFFDELIQQKLGRKQATVKPAAADVVENKVSASDTQTAALSAKAIATQSLFGQTTADSDSDQHNKNVVDISFNFKKSCGG